MTARLLLAASLCLVACGPSGMPDAGPPVDSGPPEWDDVTLVFRGACAVSASCHGGAGLGRAHLNLSIGAADGTLRDALVGVPSCEYNLMPLVDPGHPENSWLYLKIAGPHIGNRVDFAPDGMWDAGIVRNPDGGFSTSVCPLTQRGELSFGDMMPLGGSGLDARRAEVIRVWILEGAPGPP